MFANVTLKVLEQRWSILVRAERFLRPLDLPKLKYKHDYLKPRVVDHRCLKLIKKIFVKKFSTFSFDFFIIFS